MNEELQNNIKSITLINNSDFSDNIGISAITNDINIINTNNTNTITSDWAWQHVARKNANFLDTDYNDKGFIYTYDTTTATYTTADNITIKNDTFKELLGYDYQENLLLLLL